MDGSNVSVMVTVGQLTKQKVHNFVEYCKTNLDLPQAVGQSNSGGGWWAAH